MSDAWITRIEVLSLLALLFASLLKAATLIVSGNVGASHPQDLVLVGVGTGVVIDRVDATHYAVVTAAHVARYGNPRLVIYDHPRAHSHVEMTMTDPRGEDLAILIVRSKTRLPVVPLAQHAPPLNARFKVVGHPYARTWTVTHARYEQGAVAPSNALRSLVTRHSTLWICRGCDRGNSGSGIYDSQGRLLAVIYAAAPLPAYRAADERELRTDSYDPRIVRQVLAIDVNEVRRALRTAERSWRNKG
jgi:S1-C subfamily serine protease